jgi:hypothetical protein
MDVLAELALSLGRSLLCDVLLALPAARLMHHVDSALLAMVAVESSIVAGRHLVRHVAPG